MSTNRLTIYTDGACKGNGKAGDSAGGYGVFISYPDGSSRKIWGGEPATTNNRMELLAAITALESTKDIALPVTLYTDSNYVKDGISKWIHGWKQKGWKKADGKPVLNQELWQRLDAASLGRQIDWQWVKGHAGHHGNEMADSLANQGVTGSGDEFYPTDNPSHSSSHNPSSSSHPDTPPQESPMPYDHAPLDAYTPDDAVYYDDSYAPQSSPSDNESQNQTKNDSLEDTPVYDGDTSRANPYFVPILPTPINHGKPERQLIMDTETTGFEDQNGDRIVEVGMVEMVGRKFTGEKLHVYLNPDKIMDDEVIRVHGISNEFLTDKPRFADVADKIYAFMEGAELVAHNATFDMRFLKMEFAKAGYPNFENDVTVLDTLALAKQMYPGQKNSLDALVKRLDVGKKDRTFHGALLDSEILAEVYLAMTGGQVALAIDQEETEQEETQQHEDLSALAHLLASTLSNQSADSAWRAAMFGNQ